MHTSLVKIVGPLKKFRFWDF